MASMPKDRVGPPPRSLAVDAHDCIMVRIPKGSTEYKVVARRQRYDLAGSTSDCLSQTTFAARRILGMAHYCSARAFAVNPARLKARPLRAGGGMDCSARPKQQRLHAKNGIECAPTEGLSKWTDERLAKFALDKEPHTRSP